MSTQISASVIQIATERIPRSRIDAMARPVLAAVRDAFEDPKIAAEYKEWLKARRLAGKA